MSPALVVVSASANGAKDSRSLQSLASAKNVEAAQVRPFFGYYGGKWRDALKHYPEPLFETIVEPFAGSAGYSLRYADRKVVLCELDPILASVWRYLVRVKPRAGQMLQRPHRECSFTA